MEIKHIYNFKIDPTEFNSKDSIQIKIASIKVVAGPTGKPIMIIEYVRTENG